MSQNFGTSSNSNPGGMNKCVVGEYHFKHTSLSSDDKIDRKCKEPISTHRKDEKEFVSKEELLRACSEAEYLFERMQGLDVFGNEWLVLTKKRQLLLERIKKNRI